MTTFQPGSPDDVAWTMFASKQSVVLNPEEAARKTDAMMGERAKRLATPAPPPPADDRPKWRCETCAHRETSYEERWSVWCSKHVFGHAIPDFGCPQWEDKEGA